MQLTISLVGIVLLALVALIEFLTRFNRRGEEKSLRDIALSSDELMRHLRLLEPSLRIKGYGRLKLPGGMGARLAAAQRSLSRVDQKALLPAAQWLMDNMRQIEENLQSARYEVRFMQTLPLTQAGDVRIERLAQEMVGHLNGLVTGDMCVRCLNTYYQLCPLTQAELYAFPLAMKLTLLKLINEMLLNVITLQRDVSDASHFAAQLRQKHGRITNANLGTKSTAYLERLLSAFKESEDADCAKWLQAQLKALDLHALNIVQAEHLRQSENRRSLSNAITSLKVIAQLPWRELLESHNPIHGLFLKDPAGIYPKMDFESRDYYKNRVERLSRQLHVPESQVAEAALTLAAAQSDDVHGHIGYYLIEVMGESTLKKQLRLKRFDFDVHLFIKKHVRGLYRAALFAASVLVVFGFYAFHLNMLLGVLTALLATQCTRKLMDMLLRRLLPIRFLPRIQIDALTDKTRTLVVIPTLMTSPAQALAMARQLSVLYHANPDPQMHFMLLSDFADSDTEHEVLDREIMAAARSAIEALSEQIGHTSFFYVQRGRSFIPKERRYLGRERKRGALEMLNRFLTGSESDDPIAYSSVPLVSLAHHYSYVITLDSDTIMPPGSAKRLIGAISHPLQVRRKLQGQMRGCSVIAPRMEVAATTVQTRVSLLWGGSGGVDPYNAGISNLYQDLACQGSFAGKGIYTPDTFLESTAPYILPNSILSHDLLEGELAGCALASDIVLYDGHPKSAEGFLKRLHRWTRGDWQLLPWLLPLTPGQAKRTPLSGFSRHKIWDNLLRSLVPSIRLIAILASIVLRSELFLLLAMLLPDIDLVLHPSRQAFMAYLTRLMYLPREAYTLIDAIARTLHRVLISHRYMLQWVTAAQAEDKKTEATLDIIVQATAAGVTLLLSLFPLPPFWLGLVPAMLFALVPLLNDYLNGPLESKYLFTDDERAAAQNLAAQTFAFFDSFVTEKDHFLPPDNVQLHPNKGAAHRTSPTNIGLYLMSLVSAQALGFIDADQMGRRMAQTVDTLEALQKWHGQLYNWYDTLSLAPMPPYFVSSVDSGNLFACLLTSAQAVRTLAPQMDAALHTLSSRMDQLAYDMDLGILFNPTSQLFHIGYDTKNERLSEGMYDLLASESRLLSYAAIMTRKVPIRHWSRLGRTLIRTGRHATLVSWSGTMFEYLMPHILLPLTRGTLLDSAVKSAVKVQMHHKRQGVFGVSESGYFAFDPSLNYQYKAFGLPALALGSDANAQVIAPYASMLAFPLYKKETLSNLATMQKLKWADNFGLYEAVDFDRRRIGNSSTSEIVKSHMAHHQGMILCAICNGLCDNALQKYFFALPVAKAYQTLLDERMPRFVLRSRVRREAKTVPQTDYEPSSRIAQANVFPIDAHLMYGAGSTLMVDAMGNGYMQHSGVMLSRFDDLAGDMTGIRFYLKDPNTGFISSLTDPQSGGETRFETGKAVFKKKLGSIESTLSCFINPVDGAILHLVELASDQKDDMPLELADYFELSLNDQKADSAHPSFHDLFIETSRVGKAALSARRRPKDGSGKAKVLTHALCADGDMMHTVMQTDRMAFLGRNGTAASPIALYDPIERCASSVGAPIHPCMALRTRFVLPAHGKIRLLFVTLYEDEQKLTPRAIIDRYLNVQDGIRVMDLSLTQGLVTMRHLGLNDALYSLCGRLSGAILYRGQAHSAPAEPAPLGKEGLWSLGISGDLPLLSVTITSREQLPLLKNLLAAHSLYRMQGFWVDLAVIVQEAPSYERPLHQTVMELVYLGLGGDLVSKPGGIHVIEAATVQRDVIALIEAFSRLHLHGANGSLSKQLEALTVPFTPMLSAAPPMNAPSLPPLDRTFFNGFGGFTRPDYDYAIDMVGGIPTPAPWCNLVCTKDLGSLLSESGFQFTYFQNSHSGRLTRFTNDPVTPQSGEGIVIYDYDRELLFSPTLAPLGHALNHRCTHSFGVTTYQALGCDTECILSVFTDSTLSASLRSLRIKNTAPHEMRLFVSHYVDFLMGTDESDAELTYLAVTDAAVLAMHPSFPGIGYLAPFHQSPDTQLHSYAHAAFFGLTGDKPSLLMHAPLPDSTLGTVALVGNEVFLKPDQSITFTYVLGTAENEEALLHDLAQLRTDGVTARLRLVQSYWLTELNALSFSLPDEQLNIMMNKWLPYQTRTSRLFARAGFYQAGGAIGFRDQLQDMLSLIYTAPERVREHILLSAAHQYEQGDVQHWWHPERKGVRTHISDDLLFLPFVTAWYVKRTGDVSILEEDIPYLSAPPLAAGEHDRYHTPEETSYQEPLITHCLKAISHVTYGTRGLPLMKGGDWNDGMSSVGGESVWLAFFLSVVIKYFAPYCNEQTRQELNDLRDLLLKNIDLYAWDGAWYLRAFYENGEPLGSGTSESCRIDSLSQSWAVLSGIGRDRATQALDEAYKQLYLPDIGVMKLLTPPFTPTDKAGYITGYLPGIRENGGQYTHAVPWVIWAMKELNWLERAWELTNAVNPINHALDVKDAMRYRVEPYFTAGDIYTNDKQYGRGGWSMYTGSAAWLYTVTLEQLLGFTKVGDTLKMRPFVPEEWEDFAITYHYGQSTYHITCARDVLYPTLDGERLMEGMFTLTDDGRIHDARFRIASPNGGA